MNSSTPSKPPSSPEPSVPVKERSAWPPGPVSRGPGWTWLRRLKQDPLGLVQAWKTQHGDLLHIHIWPEHIVQVTDPGLIRELLVQHADALVRRKRMRDVFAQIHGQSVITTEGARWKAQRQALQPLFSPKAVQRDFDSMVQSVQQSLTHWPAETTDAFPVQSQLSQLALAIILRTLFSVKGQGTKEIEEALQIEQALRLISEVGNDAFFYLADMPDWVPWKWRFARAKRLLDAFIRGHLARRMAMPENQWPDDILSHLLRLRDGQGQRWSEQALRDECMTLFLAGHETTAASLTWWVWCMAAHPQAQARAAQEVQACLSIGKALTPEDLNLLPWLSQTVQESMRLYPVAPFLIMRSADAPLPLAGYTFPKGTLFQIPMILLHRDARWYPEPESFKPERFAGSIATPRGSYMPYGTGPRVCLGQHFAQAEIVLTAALLLQRYRIEPAPGLPPPEPALNVILKPKDPLQVRLVPVGQ